LRLLRKVPDGWRHDHIPWSGHDQLNAIPESEWREHKLDYVLEGWFERIADPKTRP